MPGVICALLALNIPAKPSSSRAQTQTRPLTIAILDFGDTGLGRTAPEKLAASLKLGSNLVLLDRDQARAAARGNGYAGSMNLSLDEARNLGAAIGCDFYLLGDAQTLRRSPSAGPPYFDSYASLFLVSARTGRLVSWQRPNMRSPTARAAEESLLAEFSGSGISGPLVAAIRHAQETERNERELTLDHGTPVSEAAPDDEKAAEADGLRLPRPFRRITPPYPDSAAEAEAEATVDLLVDLDAQGEVVRVDVARWAGFGLDQSTIETVRRLHFFPAMRNGVAVPIRILLRYNFRKPPRPE